MQLHEVSCVFDEETVSIESNLLIKETSEHVESTVRFPEHIHKDHVQVYANFLHSGYLDRTCLPVVANLIVVADFLQQYKICETLLKEIIIPQVNENNFLQIFHVLKNSSQDSLTPVLQCAAEMIVQNPEEFAEVLQYVPDDLLGTLIVSAENENKEELLKILLKVSNKTDFLQLLDSEIEKIEETNLEPDLEFSWRVNLVNVDEQGESESFSLNECRMNLGVNKKGEDFEVFVRGEPAVSAVNNDCAALFRALIVFQGTAHNFFYVPGTLRPLPHTSQKTTTISIKLVLSSQPLLLEILKKAANEILALHSMSTLSSAGLSLIISYLSLSTSPDKLIEIIAVWAEMNPSQSLSKILNSFDWRSQDSGFWANSLKKFPILSSCAEICTGLSRAEPTTLPHLQLSGEVIYVDEDPCPPLSPSGNPFLLDISDIKSPNRFKNMFVPVRSQRLSKASANELESSFKFNDFKQNYSSPSKFLSSNRQRALELIKELKRKLLNESLHRRNRSLEIFTFN